MAKPRAIKKMVLPVTAVKSMTAEHRYAILLLGLLLNEANWLRKLLVKATLSTSDTPDGQANFALTALLATTLGGKIHEGWDLVANEQLGRILDQIGLPDELKKIRDEITEHLNGKVFLRIRNNIAFHYPKRVFDFKKLDDHLDDTDAVIYMVPEGYVGDVLSHISTLAGIEPLLALKADTDYRVALEGVWNEVTHVTGLYCTFVSEALATILMRTIPDVHVEDITIPDTPDAYEHPLKFFVHPPDDIEEMRAQLKAQDDNLSS